MAVLFTTNTPFMKITGIIRDILISHVMRILHVTILLKKGDSTIKNSDKYFPNRSNF